MLDVPWTARESNDSIMKRMKWKKCLLNTIRYRHLNLIGHVIRKDCLEDQALSGKICGKRDKERRRTKFLENINLWIEKQGHERIIFFHAAPDRRNWCIMVANVCNR